MKENTTSTGKDAVKKEKVHPPRKGERTTYDNRLRDKTAPPQSERTKMPKSEK